jgi:excisionase family DNA binding protein
MAKTFPAHKIKSHLIYTVWELTQVLGCHRQTIIRWVSDRGLTADMDRKPWLIEGHEAKTFLSVRQSNRRCKLELHHCYCFGCKEPQAPAGKIADYTQQSQSTGRLTALCAACGAVMNKVIRRADLEAIQAKVEVTIQQASPRIVSREQPPSNVTLTKEDQTRVKAQ